MRLGRGTMVPFLHNNVEDMERKLSDIRSDPINKGANVIVAVETVRTIMMLIPLFSGKPH
jgi:predicted Holliday junction resolvase-like endonuclease